MTAEAYQVLAVPDFKEAVIECLAGEWGLSDASVLYSTEDTVPVGRYVALGSVTEGLWEGDENVKMRADSSLLRYDLAYSWSFHCYSGHGLRSPQLADRSVYELVEAILTVFVRGDTRGKTRLTSYASVVQDVFYGGSSVAAEWSAEDDHMEVVVDLTAVTRRR